MPPQHKRHSNKMEVKGSSQEQISSPISSSLFARIVTPVPQHSNIQPMCPLDELDILSHALTKSWAQKMQTDSQWTRLLAVTDVALLERSIWSWAGHLGPILGFKLFCVLSGSTNLEGSIPRSAMGNELRAALERVAKPVTEGFGWPSILEEAIIARWNNLNPENAMNSTPSLPVLAPARNAFQKLASATLQNLYQLRRNAKLKGFEHIVANVQMAAAYMSVITLGVVDVASDKELRSKLADSLATLDVERNFAALVSGLPISLTAFQAPLFIALAISPILLFRTCDLQNSRFGKSHFVPFMATLGDIKPASLRELEGLIWKNLFQVARCQLDAQEMVERVLDAVVTPELLNTFHFNTGKLHAYFESKFHPLHDHTSFFFPDHEVVIKTEPQDNSHGPVAHIETLQSAEAASDSNSTALKNLLSFSESLRRGLNVKGDQAPFTSELPTLPLNILSTLRASPTDLLSLLRRSSINSSDNFQSFNGSSTSMPTVSHSTAEVGMGTRALTLTGLDNPPVSDTASDHQQVLSETTLASQPAVELKAERLSNVPENQVVADFESPSPANGAECPRMVSESITEATVETEASTAGNNAHSISVVSAAAAEPSPGTGTETEVVSAVAVESSGTETTETQPVSGTVVDTEGLGKDSGELFGQGIDNEKASSSPPPTLPSPLPPSTSSPSHHSHPSTPGAELSLTGTDHGHAQPTPDAPNDVASGAMAATDDGHPQPTDAPKDAACEATPDDLTDVPMAATENDHPQPTPDAPNDVASGATAPTDNDHPQPTPDAPRDLASEAMAATDDGHPQPTDAPKDAAYEATPDELTDLSSDSGHGDGNDLPTDVLESPRIILRQSSRIAALKRQLEEEEEEEEGTPSAPTPSKRQRLSRASAHARKVKAAEDQTDGDESSSGVSSDSDDQDEDIDPPSVTRFVVGNGENPEWVSSLTLHLYSADHSEYFSYAGKYYNIEIADDIKELAAHDEDYRRTIGLPCGPRGEWDNSTTQPIKILPPASLPTGSGTICTLEYSQYFSMSAKYMQNIFREYPVIIVSGRPTRMRCNLQSLEEWGDPDELRVMHDNSKYDPHNPESVFVNATYREFFATNKCLNSLDNPLSGTAPAPVQLATDLYAALSHYPDFPAEIPVRVMNWGLLAKAHAVHGPHADRSGCCTWVAIEDGLKKWDLAFPPDETAEEELASPFAYGSEMASGRNYNRGWRWVSVLLTPGSILIMRPGTVHSVSTLSDCVALGGHFFSMPTLKYSVYSIFHTFVGSHTITNVPMDAEQQMLLRILLSWHKAICEREDLYLARLGTSADETIAHIPNVLNFADFENLVMLLNYAELILVVTPTRYSLSSSATFQNHVYRKPRQCAREIREVLLRHFALTLDPPVSDSYTDDTRMGQLMLRSLVGQAHTLWDSVVHRSELGVLGARYEVGELSKVISADQVFKAISRDLATFPGFSSSWTDQLTQSVPSSYCWPAAPGESSYVVKFRKLSK